MMKLVEDKGEGLQSLIGSRVILYCANYFYAGKLVGVNKTDVRLDDASIVYETGAHSDKTYKYAESVGTIYVRIPMIEAYGAGK